MSKKLAIAIVSMVSTVALALSNAITWQEAITSLTAVAMTYIGVQGVIDNTTAKGANPPTICPPVTSTPVAATVVPVTEVQ